jgi:myo-inositol 2-dehydrogenase/D-chiro-inositol 1-dehydrogenase
MEHVRCGLIGYGAWGQHHARAITSVPTVTLAAICARSPETIAKARSDHPSARLYTNHREMLAREQLDLCDIVLPSDLHFPVAKDVLESNRHLLLEKPMALALEHCTALVQLAQKRNRILAIGHELRMSSLWGKVKQMIDEGAIGQPLYALIELWRRPYRQGSAGWRYDPARVGDWILEEPIHFFDLARWYFSSAGEPTSVYAAASSKQPNHPDLHDNFSAILHFPAGRYAVISQTLAAWEHHQTAKITGTTGAIWASWSGAVDRTFEPTFTLKVMRAQPGDPSKPAVPVETISVDKPSGEVYELVDQIAAVVSAVQNSNPVPCTAEDGWWSTNMCLSAAQSLATGNPIPLTPP